MTENSSCISQNKRHRIQKWQSRNGQSRETSNVGYTIRRKTQHNTICVGHHYSQANTNNVNKTRARQRKNDRTTFFICIHITWNLKQTTSSHRWNLVTIILSFQLNLKLIWKYGKYWAKAIICLNWQHQLLDSVNIDKVRLVKR